MRIFLDGTGADSTAAVKSYLAANRQLRIADLYVISTAPNYRGQFLGQTFLVTDYPSPLLWSHKGTFTPGVISRNGIESKIGMEVDTLEVTWSPTGDLVAGSFSILKGINAGIFDNGYVELWRCLMPTAGDCDTLGACLMFAGRIGDIEMGRSSVKLKVNSLLETLNEQVPTNIIEPTNILAQYSVGTTPPNGPPAFATVSGGSLVKVYATAVSAPGGYSPANGIYDAGYVVFRTGHLAGTYRGIRSQTIESGNHAFYLYEALPFAPAVSDQFAAYIPTPRDYAGATEFAGFPYVPQPINSPVIL